MTNKSAGSEARGGDGGGHPGQRSRERGARCCCHRTDRCEDRAGGAGSRVASGCAAVRAGRGRPAVGTGPGPQPGPPREARLPCLASSQGPTRRCCSASRGEPGKGPSGDSPEATWPGRSPQDESPAGDCPVLVASHVLLVRAQLVSHTPAVVLRPEAPTPHLSREAYLSHAPDTVTCLPARPSQPTRTGGPEGGPAAVSWGRGWSRS